MPTRDHGSRSRNACPAATAATGDADADSEIDREEIAGNAFDLWDADGNGSVSESEWETSTELWYPEGSGPDVIDDWDADGDSGLDSDEFRECFDSSPLGESWAAGAVDRKRSSVLYFELYDTGRRLQGD